MKYALTAQRLKEALNDNKMIPQELSERTGINKSSISQYVNGSHAPSNISSGKMANVLGVNPLWLMGYDVPKIERPAASSAALPPSREELDLLEAYRNADPDIQFSVRTILGIKKESSTLSKAE